MVTALVVVVMLEEVLSCWPLLVADEEDLISFVVTVVVVIWTVEEELDSFTEQKYLLVRLAHVPEPKHVASEKGFWPWNH